ncbi:MAG: PhoH family protein [Erysipelotrichaceae bacterium]|nr:PhoH family protein [Erysipelotrichaceae bacterium]
MNKFSLSLQEYTIEEIMKLCGPQDVHINILRDIFHIDIVVRDNQIFLLSEDENVQKNISSVVNALLEMITQKIEVTQRDVIYACKLAKLQKLDQLSATYQEAIGKTVQGKRIYPKTIGQRYLYKCMKNSEIVFATGVAGTGKTYLAVVYAASLLKKGEIQKIILTRPAVEAGESLGFLPGDLKEKVDPYLRPLYDALYEVLGAETVEKFMEKEIIEIAPLAYMRGRTLNQAFIILDEAQNTTQAQMKMFLTRMGFHSRIVITGDITQIDLIHKKDSGLLNAKQLLEGIPGISFVELTSLDVVRNPLVQKIIERYEQEESKHG